MIQENHFGSHMEKTPLTEKNEIQNMAQFYNDNQTSLFTDLLDIRHKTKKEEITLRIAKQGWCAVTHVC